MGKRSDLSSRLDQATGASTPMVWDRKISRALIRRREDFLATRSSTSPATDTERIQARLAEARAREEAEGASG